MNIPDSIHAASSSGNRLLAATTMFLGLLGVGAGQVTRSAENVLEIERATPYAVVSSASIDSAQDTISVSQPVSWISVIGGAIGLASLITNQHFRQRDADRAANLAGLQADLEKARADYAGEVAKLKATTEASEAERNRLLGRITALAADLDARSRQIDALLKIQRESDQ